MGVTNSSGGVLYRNTYEEYGAFGPSNGGRFSFTGQIVIPELALLHYKARTYNAALGRFLPPQAGFAIVFQDRGGAVDAQSENPALYPWVRVVCAVHGKVGTKLRKAMPGTSPGIGQTMILTTRLRAQV